VLHSLMAGPGAARVPRVAAGPQLPTGTEGGRGPAGAMLARRRVERASLADP
jgi:hypothetical protein